MKRLSPVDREALERAIEIARNSGEPGRREQIDRLMEKEGWFAAADFCCYCCQRELIRPRLWQPTPADIDPADIETIISSLAATTLPTEISRRRSCSRRLHPTILAAA
jgi:hypothetical protein